MQTYLAKLDDLAGIRSDQESLTIWLERIAFVFLVLMIISAPHSIAATQTAWLTGMFVWVGRLFASPRPKLKFGLLDIALWGFFAWSVITSLTSYAPDISINKLRGAAVFLIFYFVLYNLRNRRATIFLAIALVVSCMVNVLWMPVQRAIGRGVEIHGVRSDSPLAKAKLIEGDTLLDANGRKFGSPEDVVAAVGEGDVTKIKFYRPDFEFVVEVKRTDLLGGSTAMEQLGIESWKKSRNWRSSGFYSHYTTYAEVLQLIGSLVMGMFVAFVAGWIRSSTASGWLRNRALILLAILAAMSFALLLTVTRASQLAFMISAAAIVLVGLGRKWLLAAVVICLPIAIAGLLFLQQSRQVGFFDPNDDSIKWRQTVWREGFDLWTSSPRNFVLGVGMDSIKRYAAEWHMFDDGRLNMGHFHSTPLNLVVERGLPALLLWLMVLGVYARSLWRGIKSSNSLPVLGGVADALGGRGGDPLTAGILLGCLGGMIGFFASGLVHYNLGDQEVAMVFFILMAIGMKFVLGDDDSEVPARVAS